jgi:acetyltransferase-like isoleucine patch superfamily enzyme
MHATPKPEYRHHRFLIKLSMPTGRRTGATQFSVYMLSLWKNGERVVLLLKILRDMIRRRDPLLQMGRGSHGVPNIVRYAGDIEPVIIGSYCSIADGVSIYAGGNHRSDWVSTFPFRIVFNLPGALRDGIPESRGPVTIGNDVWVGRWATIMSGVTIGDGAVVGARAVVAKDVRPYAIVVGNPAREIRRRFSDEIIEKLLKVRWWDWPEEEIIAAVPLLCSPDVENLLREVEKFKG